MICEECQSTTPENSRFCASCGSAVAASNPERILSIKGRLLEYDWRNSTGIITGEDGFRYHFKLENWKSEQMPARGMKVDFTANEGSAHEVFLIAGYSSSGSDSSDSRKLIGGLLAILIGSFGAHKFYMNSVSNSGEYTLPGVLLLLAGTVGWLLIVPGIISAVIGIVEGVIYLTKSGEEFHQIYIVNKRKWF